MLPDDHQVKRVIVTCHHNVTIKINNLNLHRGILKWTIMSFSIQLYVDSFTLSIMSHKNISYLSMWIN